MIVILNVTLYKCEYCGKKYQSKHHGQWHETHCYGNPNNQHKCFEQCKFLNREPLELHGRNSSPGEPESYYVKSFFCLKKDVILFSYVAERKKLITLHPEQFEGAIRMPLECEDYLQEHNDLIQENEEFNKLFKSN